MSNERSEVDVIDSGSKSLALFTLAYCSFTLAFILNLVDLGSNTTIYQLHIPLLLTVTGLTSVLLILFTIRFRFFQLVIIFTLAAILIISWRKSHSSTLIIGYMLIVLSQNVDLKKIIRMDLIIRIPLVFGVMIASKIGVLSDRLVTRFDEVKVRHSVGFTHPNNLGAMFLVISLYWFYLRHRKFRAFDYVGITILAWLCDHLTDSRTSSMMIIVLIAFECLNSVAARFGHFQNIKKFTLQVMGSLIIFIPAASLYVARYYVSGKGLFVMLDKLLNSRAYLAYLGLKNNGISLFGQYVKVIPWGQANNFETTNAIDNFYVYAAVNFGIIALLILLGAILFTYYRLLQAGQYALCICLLAILITGISENQIFNIGENAFLLTINLLIFQKQKFQHTASGIRKVGDYQLEK